MYLFGMFAEFWKFQSKIFEIRRGLIRISWMHSALFCIMHYINNTTIEFEQKIVQRALTSKQTNMESEAESAENEKETEEKKIEARLRHSHKHGSNIRVITSCK